MTALSRVRVLWSGFSGSPGISTFYFLDTATAVASLHDLFDAVKTYLPDDVHIVVDPSGDIIEDTTGDLTGAWGADAAAEVVGTSTDGFPAPAGAMIGWGTATILDGSRVRGKTFLVPAAANAYQTNGTLSDAAVTAISGAALEFIIEQADSFVIWHRPRLAKAADGSRPAVTARDGGHALVTTSRVPDKAVVLRSRRD